MTTLHPAYDRLADDTELAETLETMKQAKAEHEAGLSKPAEYVFSELKADLKARYPDDLKHHVISKIDSRD